MRYPLAYQGDKNISRTRMRISINVFLRLIMKRFGRTRFGFHRDRYLVNTIMDRVFQIPENASRYLSKTKLSNCDAYIIEPPSTIPGRSILFLHGGALCFSMWKFYIPFAYEIAAKTRARLLLPDYRLAPENPFPAGLNDGAEAMQWISKNWGERRRVLLIGDSAGGNIALNVARDFEKTCGLVLLSPWLDLSHSSKWMYINDADDMVHPEAARRAAWLYINGSSDWSFGEKSSTSLERFEKALTDPRVSPLFSDLSFANGTPVLIQASTSERLLGDSLELWRRLGGPDPDLSRTELDRDPLKLRYKDHFFSMWPDVPHVWQVSRMSTLEAKEAIADMVEFIDNVYSSS